MSSTICSICSQSDVEHVVRQARHIALLAAFDRVGQERVALVVSELATNLVRYAPGGTISIQAIQRAERVAVEIVSTDSGPGIEDVDLALTDGYSTGRGLGSGLPAVRRLSNELDVSSDASGTRISAVLWMP